MPTLFACAILFSPQSRVQLYLSLSQWAFFFVFGHRTGYRPPPTPCKISNSSVCQWASKWRFSCLSCGLLLKRLQAVIGAVQRGESPAWGGLGPADGVFFLPWWWPRISRSTPSANYSRPKSHAHTARCYCLLYSVGRLYLAYGIKPVGLENAVMEHAKAARHGCLPGVVLPALALEPSLSCSCPTHLHSLVPLTRTRLLLICNLTKSE